MVSTETAHKFPKVSLLLDNGGIAIGYLVDHKTPMMKHPSKDAYASSKDGIKIKGHIADNGRAYRDAILSRGDPDKLATIINRFK